MSKARTLADFISDGSEFADGTISVAEVSGAAPLASPTFTGTVGATTITSTGGLTLNTTDANGTGIALGLDGDKKVRFYDDQGATTKMYWNASTVTQKFEDNSKLAFGSSEDLQLYHDGLASYITENGTGSLFISGSNMWLKSSGGDTYILCNDTTDTVSLYQANAKKLETSSTGVEVTGKTTTDELDLNAIAATISDTAVDIFVYDTRKDSDGGAWRKRTQHTSWYNETLNTSTRGSRKEFPAVAVIVAESNQVTIYDGDDPDLPMWMVFNEGGSQDNSNMLNGVAKVSALNATLVVSGFALTISFLKDSARAYRDSSVSLYWNGPYNGNIAERNALKGWTKLGSPLLVNGVVNDVAMTVLPNAPIDATTGLPVPTIAVATDGGTSVITDSGAVYDITGFSPVENVNFYGDRLAINTPVGSTSYINVGSAILNSDTTSGAWEELEINSTTTNDLKILPNQSAHQAFDDTYYSAGSGGLLSVKPDYTAPETCLHAFTTSSYNTGWMNGDIKLATLSDTDATNVTGSELVTNGTFDTDVSGWTGETDTSATYDSGRLKVTKTASSGPYGIVNQTITTVAGKQYLFQADSITGSGPSAFFRFNDGALGAYTETEGTTHRAYFTATSTSTKIAVGVASTAESAYIFWDNISVQATEEDRSVNGNGLQVFGTVTKSAVNTGADLVGYSNWGLTNYVKQPPNADLAVNSDRTFVTWFKTTYTGNYSYLFSLSGSTLYYGLGVNVTNGYLYAYDNINNIDLTSTAVADGSWHCAAMVHSGGYKKLYVDGKLVGTFAASDVTIDSDANFYLGVYYNGTSLDYNLSGGSLALARFSHTAASPEQIKKIYEDEKVLFQEGAQATLYGLSDAVTALAYDDSTELLHVGTSAGRSVFQGLRRVDNTTTAVGAAISASNGLVADE